MWQGMSSLLDHSDFMPRWSCGNWSAALGWTHILADLGTFGAYTAIPCVLGYFIWRRRDLPFPGLFFLFCCFIFACGTTHLIDACLFWWPVYRVSAIARVGTALVSWATVIALAPVIPKALAMRSPLDLEREIDARRRVELVLRARSVALDTAMDGIAIFDDDKACVYLNSAWAKQYGYAQREDALRLRFTRFHDEAAVDTLQSDPSVELGSKHRWRGEAAARRRDDSRFTAEISITSLQMGGFVVVSRDVSDRKRVEQERQKLNQTLENRVAEQTAELRRQSQLFQCVLDSMAEGVVVVNARAEIVHINPAAAHMFGQGEASVAGTTWPAGLRVLDADGKSPCAPDQTPVIRAVNGEQVDDQRIVIDRSPDAEPLWLSVTARPLQTLDGSVQGAVGVYRDIGLMREARAAEIFYAEQLEKNNRELSRSIQELDDFAHVVSHDLKEPLRRMHHYAVFLLEDDKNRLDEEGVRKLSTLQHLARRMEEMLEALLQFSRIGRIELAVTETPLRDVIQDAIDTLRINVGEQDVEWRISDEIPAICCDRIRITEVFRNLIANALEYNDKDRRIVEIGCLSASTAPDNALGRQVIYIRDNGIGIAEKHRETIFRMFRRLHGRDQYGGGLGAGLAIAKKIVERHGGQIWVESTVGQGSTFFVALPPRQGDPS